MSAPRLEIDLAAICANTRTLVDLLAPRGIRVTGVSKAAVGGSGVAAAMLRGGVSGLGDSRVENVERLRAGGLDASVTLIRSPMPSQAERVVRAADISLNTEPTVLAALSNAAVGAGLTHGVVLMVELGDLREGIAVEDVADVVGIVEDLPGLTLLGLGTNLACQNGVVPDQRTMDALSRLVEHAERACGRRLPVVSGGNSANLEWALSTSDVARIDDLRLGESILLGTEPLHRRPIDGLSTEVFALVGEVIELRTKPSRPWGDVAQSAFGTRPAQRPAGLTRQAIVALGRQDVDPDGLVPPSGITVLGASSDHLVLDVGDHELTVGDELPFGLDYSALVRAMTSPFVEQRERGGVVEPVGRPTLPAAG
ncbi:alanine/ornithine racemase family PLP-dependent enzyme [Aeromicrobium sp. CF4.19]|uniref:alanine/ornithine racemase family PLP-dependent enzyme n=1 Tax=Aeromicrobium sp. CF4.19 TaxID=3373082 RepID=UPI003EE5C496